jgi:acyl-CoA thioesterase-1
VRPAARVHHGFATVSEQGLEVRGCRWWSRVNAIVRLTAAAALGVGLSGVWPSAPAMSIASAAAQRRTEATPARSDRRAENVVQAVRRSYERRPPEWRRRTAACLHYLDEAEAFHHQGEAYFVAASRARSSPEQSRLVRLGNDAIRERQRLIAEFWACTRRMTTGDEFASQDRPPAEGVPPPHDPAEPPAPPDVIPPGIPVPLPPEGPGSWLPPGFPLPPAEARPRTRRSTPSPPGRTPRRGVPVIVALGDSLTADGTRLTTAEAWPGVVEERLKAQGHDYQVKNAGVDNDTSAMALARLNRVLAPNTKVVIVAIGMNDFKARRPIAEIRSNIGAIIRQAQARNIKVLLCAFEEELHGSPYDGQFRDMYPTIAAQHGVPMIEDLTGVIWKDPRAYTSDGIHPNARGARQMAYKILGALRPMLGVSSPTHP